MVYQSLLRSRKVWIAVFAIIAKVVAVYYPDFPVEIWQAIEQLAMVLIAAITVEDAAAKFGGSR